MKAKLRLSQPGIKSRLCFLLGFFFGGGCSPAVRPNLPPFVHQHVVAAARSQTKRTGRCCQAVVPPADDRARSETRSQELLNRLLQELSVSPPDLTSLCLQLFIPRWPNPKPRPDGTVRAVASGPHQSYAGQDRPHQPVSWHLFFSLSLSLNKYAGLGNFIRPQPQCEVYGTAGLN